MGIEKLTYDAFTEKEITSLLKAGDIKLFTYLYEKYSPKLYNGIYKLVKSDEIAEEIVQEIFTRIWQKKEDIQYEANFASYIYRIGQNLVKDYYRKLQRNHAMYEHFKVVATEYYTHIEEAIHHRENQELLNDALMSMSPQQRNVYRLCKIDGLTYKEAASALGISFHTVKEYLTKANQALSAYLKDHPDAALMLILFAFLYEI